MSITTAQATCHKLFSSTFAFLSDMSNMSI